MTRLAWFLSFCAGFISLSEEILWVRIVGFIFESTPRAFAMVLAGFLGGIALGALIGKRLSERGRATPATAAWLLLLAGLLLLALPSLIVGADGRPWTNFLLLVLILLGAAVKGTLFPIVHHLGSLPGERLGRSVSRTYFCNILGATLGPLLTGLFLLEHFSSGSSLHVLALLCFLCALPPLFVSVKGEARAAGRYGFTVALAGLLVLPLLWPVGAGLMQQLARVGTGQLHLLIENRHGVVHSVSQPGDDDSVLGGNVYDGKTNIDLLRNSNMIDRAYLLYGLHPAPKRVLVIGLSSGAWTRIIGMMPGVERIDVVEINPAYVEMIRAYPQLSPLLDDPRLHLHIDDGRRWLRRSHAQFDLIVMNTTFHWRANITNLLSVEMQRLMHDALAPGGILAFNTTDSYDAFLTAASVFPHAYMFRNFVYAGKHDFREELPQLPQRLKKFNDRGVPLFADTRENNQALAKLAGIKFIQLQQIARIYPRPLQVVTDQNMITEFRFGRGAEEGE
ncbi:hypothetical protein VX159_02355 [Dechloromonas sp. ZY10]|uniref:spermidine synthase n=1 Tax=Dechloromonas aquae TaxID=2664436 RepID=UPI0035277B6B